MTMKPNNTIGKKLAAIVNEIRKHKVCAYMGERCDCKYGADRITNGIPSESGNGCPELRCVSAILENLTDTQIKRLLKNAPFFVILP